MQVICFLKALPNFLNQEWIMEQWDKNYYITSLAGASNGSALVIMSKGELNNTFLHLIYWCIKGCNCNGIIGFD